MNKQSNAFGYLPVATILNKAEIESIIGDLVPALEKHGGQRWDADMISHPAPIFFFVVTGGTEQKILQIRDRRKRITPREPVLIIAHPGNNSLPAALEVLACLQQDGDRGKILYLKGPGDESGLRQIAAAAGDVETFHQLQRARIGLVGPSSGWLVASSPDPEVVQAVWGPEVVPVEFDELKQYLADIPREETGPILDSLRSKAAGVREPSDTELEDAVRVYLALKKVIDAHELEAVAVRCFDLVLGQKTTGCFAMAQLNDEGVTAGCEGDLVSTVGMLWTRELLGQISWMANPAQVDVEGNTVWLAHCTVAGSMVKVFCLRSHFESGLGVAIQGTLPKGPVTLLRIGGRQMDRIWLAEGEILQTGEREDLCRTQTEVRLTGAGAVENLLSAPLGNHLVLVRGHHSDRLRGWWKMMVAST